MGWALIIIGCMVAEWLVSEAAEKWIKDTMLQCNVTVVGCVIAMVFVACAGAGALMYPQNQLQFQSAKSSSSTIKHCIGMMHLKPCIVQPQTFGRRNRTTNFVL